MMESFATPYPLMFLDGDQEVDKGPVGVHSVLQFKRFQAQLSRLIGIPANQLSAVFVCRRSSEKRQKLPINENTNFNILLNQHNPSKEKDCYFLVSLKKSKKERKVGTRRRSAESENVDDDDSTSSRGDVSPASQRPGKEVDDNFTFEVTSPNSVLDQAEESEKKVDGSSTPEEAEIPVVEVKEVAELVVTVKTTNETRIEGLPSSTQVVENPSPPVTRIGGQQLVSRSSGEHSKFGAIGSTKALEAASAGGYYSVSPEALSQAARFKDPVQQQGSVGGRPVMQRVNGVPVFADGLNMRLLTGRLANNNNTNNNVNNSHASFQQGLPSVHSQLAAQAQAHFQEQQQQQHARFSFQQQQRLVRSGEGYGRGGVEQYCPDCASYQERNIRPPPFHCCINDRITSGFNGPSPAGPIERPVKRQLKAVA